MKPVYLGLGSNVGDPVAQIRKALERIRGAKGIRILRVSSLYRTEPQGETEQDWFVNAVAEVETSLLPLQLLDLLQEIETRMERNTPYRWGPRSIDLDILFFGNRIVEEPELTIPHPLVEQRRFVLEPLVELAPNGIHPLNGKTFQDLLEELGTAQQVERLAEAP